MFMLIYLAVASWVVVFLAVSLIAAVLGFTAIAGTALNIAWILFAVGLILLPASQDWAVGRGSKGNARD